MDTAQATKTLPDYVVLIPARDWRQTFIVHETKGSYQAVDLFNGKYFIYSPQRVCVCVRMCVCVRVCVCVRMCVCVRKTNISYLETKQFLYSLALGDIWERDSDIIDQKISLSLHAGWIGTLE